MKITRSLSKEELSIYLEHQINTHFPDQNPVTSTSLLNLINKSDERAFACFSGIRKKYFNEGGETKFNHLHSDQYCMYLAMLSRFAYKNNFGEDLATKLYYLNKVMHSVDIHYFTELPNIFLLIHPLNTILGRATFSDHFIAYQNCTVGCLNEGVFPVFKGKTILYSNANVLGKCMIGDNVCIGAGVSVVNTDVPDNSIVTGQYPNYTIKENHNSIFNRPPFKYE